MNCDIMKKTEKGTILELEKQIKAVERSLDTLREEYLKRTGQLPPRDIRDFSWKWTIFMVLGFAFISCIVYLLGIAKVGKDEATGIPAFFFHTDISYFGILTFYIIIMALVAQSNKINGYQTIILLSGFWCAHWLIYDWTWYAIKIGMGLQNLDGFWERGFGSPILIPHPPMWMFLTCAILGGFMALYTFSIPKGYKELAPPLIWLYATYFNPSILEFSGIEDEIILIVGVVLIILAFSLAAVFSILRLQKGLPNWLTNRENIKKSINKKNWHLDPLSPPWILIIVVMLVLMHLFLVLIPVIGLFFGFISWFLVPFYYILFKASSGLKYSKIIQIIILVILIAITLIIMYGMHLYAL